LVNKEIASLFHITVLKIYKELFMATKKSVFKKKATVTKKKPTSAKKKAPPKKKSAPIKRNSTLVANNQSSRGKTSGVSCKARNGRKETIAVRRG